MLETVSLHISYVPARLVFADYLGFQNSKFSPTFQLGCQENSEFDSGSPTNENSSSPVGNNKNSLVDVSGGGDGTAPASVNATINNNTLAKDDSAEPLKIPADQRSQDYKKLIQYGLDEKVAAKLDDIYNTGKLAHCDLDERALDALKEFPVDGALTVLKQFLDSNLEHVSNKSAYLCGVMKTYRQKSRSGQTSAPPVQSPVKGPDESKIKAILERTGYSLDVTTGQRKYGGPPPNWDGLPPGNGCEVFCGKIPKDMYEDELIPLFEKCGTIWDLRLMMDPMTGLNRGYAFVTFNNREGAQEAVRQLNDYEIRKGKKIGVTISYNNHRLFVGNIPKNRDRDELFEEFSKHAPGLTEVIIYSSPDDRKKNRGFCFLEYESHKSASLAKRRLGTSRVKVWGCDIIVDWADPQEEPDDETMSKVKVLYVRNLTQEVTEEKLKESFEAYGRVDRVKKIKDYAFVHFEERDAALKAMDELNAKEIGGSNIEISLAKPPSDKKKKEEILRARERRMMQMMTQRPPSPDGFFRVIPPIPIRGGVRGGVRAGPMGRGDFGWPWPWGDGSWSRGGNGNGTNGRWADGGGDSWNSGAASGGGGSGWGANAFRTVPGPQSAFPWAWNPPGRASFGTNNGWRPSGDQRQQKQQRNQPGKYSAS
ncbi:unnamed protein product [Allacma fusca]|uniref:RRM domain-containing protein n=1 Tax=Allacma fusca TaxID=39272 RepID=A0A8J2LFY7_9HEXA|nr:unnamed protein product [Allacma fusca]